jgi:phosphate/sulfate permease
MRGRVILSGRVVVGIGIFIAAVLAVILGSSDVQAIGAIVAVLIVMSVLVDLISPRANRLHFRYRGQWGFRSYGDRHIEAADEADAHDVR